MRLVYRGISYFRFPPDRMAIAQFQATQASCIPDAIIPLKYRGIAHLKLD